jgi:hypothetical protein
MIRSQTEKLARGQALVEFAFMLPLLLLIIANIVNFGGLFYAAITVANAARHGSQYWALGGASVGAPSPPSATLIHSLLTQDTLPLLNPSSLAVRSCVENKANPSTPSCTTIGSGTFTNPAVDSRSEAGLYVMAWVDVQYSYQPYIPLFRIAGIPLTTPPQVLRRQSVMRRLQ